MKILFDHSGPFLLAHGGFQIQIEQTKSALEAVGVEVDYLRWWDANQKGDLIHYFGRPTAFYLQLAQAKGFKFVIAELLTGMGSRSALRRNCQRVAMSIAERFAPDWAMFRFGWDSYRRADACVAGTEWEAHLMRTMFRVPEGRLHVVPNGVERVFLESAAVPRGPWLVCTAAITERKRVLELAEAAVQAQTPVWIIGKSYGEADPYMERFQHFARQHSALVRYEGAIGDRAQLARIYREARGFVLLSAIETRSLSAEEAAACECPLLLSDLPWARSVFGEHARYCPITRSAAKTARVLREFYQAAPSLPLPQRPLGWIEVGKQFASIYASILRKS